MLREYVIEYEGKKYETITETYLVNSLEEAESVAVDLLEYFDADVAYIYDNKNNLLRRMRVIKTQGQPRLTLGRPKMWRKCEGKNSRLFLLTVGVKESIITIVRKREEQ